MRTSFPAAWHREQQQQSERGGCDSDRAAGGEALAQRVCEVGRVHHRENLSAATALSGASQSNHDVPVVSLCCIGRGRDVGLRRMVSDTACRGMNMLHPHPGPAAAGCEGERPLPRGERESRVDAPEYRRMTDATTPRGGSRGDFPEVHAGAKPREHPVNLENLSLGSDSARWWRPRRRASLEARPDLGPRGWARLGSHPRGLDCHFRPG